MESIIIWRASVPAPGGDILYLVMDGGQPQPYGLAICAPDSLAVQAHISWDKAFVIRLAQRLAQGEVRPCHLRDILEDVLCI